MTPEEYFTKDEIDYLIGKLKDTKRCLHLKKTGRFNFEKETEVQMLILENCIEMALKIPMP